MKTNQFCIHQFVMIAAMLALVPSIGCAQQQERSSGGSFWEQALRVGVGAASERQAQKDREELEKEERRNSEEKKYDFLSGEHEQILGEQAAARILEAAGPLSADVKLQRYVNFVGRTVARQSARAEIVHAFGVVESDAVGAWAAPGGWVFVTTGLLKRLQTESELAGVLATQIAHVSLRSAERRLEKDDSLRTARRATNDDARFSAIERAAQSVANLVMNDGYGTTITFEADAAAARMATAAGYDPNGLRNAMVRIRESGSARIANESKIENRLPELEGVLMNELSGMTGAINQERYLSSVAILGVKQRSASIPARREQPSIQRFNF